MLAAGDRLKRRVVVMGIRRANHNGVDLAVRAGLRIAPKRMRTANDNCSGSPGRTCPNPFKTRA
jgi:hypothetical protein